MARRYFEDFFDGLTVDLGTVEFTAEGIMEFARAYDPQPMHTDPDAARDSIYGGVNARGLDTCRANKRPVGASVICPEDKLRPAGGGRPGWVQAGVRRDAHESRCPVRAR